eukprot:g3078.t1
MTETNIRIVNTCFGEARAEVQNVQPKPLHERLKAIWSALDTRFGDVPEQKLLDSKLPDNNKKARLYLETISVHAGFTGIDVWKSGFVIGWDTCATFIYDPNVLFHPDLKCNVVAGKAMTNPNFATNGKHLLWLKLWQCNFHGLTSLSLA